jgi:CHRD domain-containing protein
MKKHLALAAVTLLVFGVTGCGDDNNSPTTPSNTTIFTVQLSALNEVPAVSNAEATARGTAVITVNSSTNNIDFAVSLNSFPAGSTVNVAHIHAAAAGTNAGVLVNTGLTAGSVTLTNGAGTFSFQSVTTSAANVAAILANPQNHYFNVHTTLNPGGAIRGQLR